MAATYTIPATDIAFAANKCMAGVFNGTGSGKVLRVYRIWILNNQYLVQVTGVLTNIELRKITAASGGTTIVPTKHNRSSADLPAQVVVGTNMTITLSSLYKRILWSTDDPVTAHTTAALTLDEIETFPSFSCVWSLGFADPNTEPITLREGEGLAVYNTGASAGQCDIFIEMTAT